MTEEEVNNILGTPIHRTEYEEIKGNRLANNYNNMTIHFIKEYGQYVACEMYLFDGDGKGPREIKLGDSKQSIIDKFYCEENMKKIDDIVIFYDDDTNHGENGFNINDDKEYIMYYTEKMTFKMILDSNSNVSRMELVQN